jgi:hypothetical protein
VRELKNRIHFFIISIFDHRNAFRPTMLNSSTHFTRSKAPKSNPSTTNRRLTRYDQFCASVWPPQCGFLVFYFRDRPSVRFCATLTMALLSEVVVSSKHVPSSCHRSAYLYLAHRRDVSTLFNDWATTSLFFWGASISCFCFHWKATLVWPSTPYAVLLQSCLILSNSSFAYCLSVSECWFHCQRHNS